MNVIIVKLVLAVSCYQNDFNTSESISRGHISYNYFFFSPISPSETLGSKKVGPQNGENYIGTNENVDNVRQTIIYNDEIARNRQRSIRPSDECSFFPLPYFDLFQNSVFFTENGRKGVCKTHPFVLGLIAVVVVKTRIAKQFVFVINENIQILQYLQIYTNKNSGNTNQLNK